MGYKNILQRLNLHSAKPLPNPSPVAGTPTQLQGHGEIPRAVVKTSSEGWHLLRAWSSTSRGLSWSGCGSHTPAQGLTCPQPARATCGDTDGTATCPAAGARQRHNTQHRFILILGTHQKGGVSSNENRDFLQATWMSQPVTSLGIPKICIVKKSQLQIGLISYFPLTE